MPNVTFHISDGRTVNVEARIGARLLDVARMAGIPIDAPCSGNATCGKCRVYLKSGELSSEINRHIKKEQYEDGHRLACVSSIATDCEIEVPESALAFQTQIRTYDADVDFYKELRGRYPQLNASEADYQIFDIELNAPSSDDQAADAQRAAGAIAAIAGTGEEELKFSSEALKALPVILADHGFKASVLLRRSDKRILLIGAPGSLRVLGAAIDIGTTTVSALLVDILSGEVLAAGSAGNGQIRYGADVINRIIEQGKPGGEERLRKALTDDCLTPLLSRLLREAGTSELSQIVKVSIAGNTTMMHLLLGISASRLRLEPYVPAFFKIDGLSGGALKLGIHTLAEVGIAPAVGSYVGGDITAGAIICGIAKSDTYSLFIDLGTNGEIVFGSGDFLVTAACSAGPAFEGGDISSGMRATDGAIESVYIEDDCLAPKLSIIGEPGQMPAGICGSGLIDLISELFRTGIIDAKGKFSVENERIRKDEWGLTRYVLCEASETMSGEEIAVMDSDIDNFIRAKGSVFSAVRSLLSMTDMDFSVLSDVYIAGGIGSGIDIEKAISIGMLPNLPLTKYHYLGNTSLQGAYASLIFGAAREEIEAVAALMTYIELSALPSYMDEFVAACFIPHTNTTLFSAV